MTTEVASFSEYPGAWIIWSVNLACVLAIVFIGGVLAVKKKVLILLPLVLGIGATHGFRWFVASLHHDYPIPKVTIVQEVVDDPGQAIPLISHSTRVDIIAWGAALTVICAAAAEKKKANQPLQPTRLHGAVFPTRPLRSTSTGSSKSHLCARQRAADQ